MAYFNVEFPDNLMKQITKMDNDDVSRRILKESTPILAKSVQDVIRAEHSETGDLWRSIEAFEPYRTHDGVWISSACPTGRAKGQMKKGKVYARSKSGTMTKGQALYNNDKLWFLEYGTSKQPATPILTKATKNAQQAVIEKMQEVYNEAVKVE
jgi:HK97 gp10 family phage protein